MKKLSLFIATLLTGYVYAAQLPEGDWTREQYMKVQVDQFLAMDKNKNNIIDPTENRSRRLQGMTKDDYTKMFSNLFTKLDENSDNVLTSVERKTKVESIRGRFNKSA